MDNETPPTGGKPTKAEVAAALATAFANFAAVSVALLNLLKKKK